MLLVGKDLVTAQRPCKNTTFWLVISYGITDGVNIDMDFKNKQTNNTSA